MQCACAVLSSVACLALQYFPPPHPHYLINLRFSKKEKGHLQAKCVFWFPPQLLSETFLVLRRTEKNVHRSSCKVPIHFSRQILMKLEFSRRSPLPWKILKCQISWKSIEWEPSCSMWTDTRKLIFSFRSFAYAPKNGIFYFTLPPPSSSSFSSSSSSFYFADGCNLYFYNWVVFNAS